MNRRGLFAATLLRLLLPGAVFAQPRYVDGVFVHAGDEPIELLAFAEAAATGQLRLSSGSFEDVPAVPRVHRLLCSLPTWTPVRVWISTKAIFSDEFAERRQLAFAVRRLNIYALELRVADLETTDRAARLVRAVGGTGDRPALVFVTMQTGGGVRREYMIELRVP